MYYNRKSKTMKLKIYKIIILLLIVSSCSTSKDKFNVLNDYIKLEIKDTTRGIVIVQEKISPNYTIKKFDDCVLSAYHLRYPFRGDSILYNVKNWTKMKNKYAIKQLKDERFYLKKDFWTKEDFLFKKFAIENIKEIKNISSDDTKYNIHNTNIYGFSEPIYYKKKSVIVFAVTNFTYKMISTSSTYLVIMKKKKGKWMVLDYVVNEW
jgi:hypothetical protein